LTKIRTDCDLEVSQEGYRQEGCETYGWQIARAEWGSRHGVGLQSSFVGIRVASEVADSDLHLRYIEYNKSKNKELKGKHNPLFKKMAREQQRRKAQRLDG
jgi:hypothetical protein